MSVPPLPVETELLSLLDGLSDGLSRDQRDELFSFIGAGEYGVAFEALCAALIEGKRAVTPAIHDRMECIGRKMRLDASTWEDVPIGPG